MLIERAAHIAALRVLMLQEATLDWCSTQEWRGHSMNELPGEVEKPVDADE
jgi:hypothetical protein